MVRISFGSLLGHFDLETGDPYVSFGPVGSGIRTQTKAVKNGGRRPNWQETYVMNEFDTSTGHVIEVQVYDHNRLRHDHLIGSGQINISRLSSQQLSGATPVRVEMYDKKGNRVGSLQVNVTIPGYTPQVPASTLAAQDYPKILLTIVSVAGLLLSVLDRTPGLRYVFQLKSPTVWGAVKPLSPDGRRVLLLLGFTFGQADATREAAYQEVRLLQERQPGAPLPRTVVVETPEGNKITEVVEMASHLPLTTPAGTTTTGLQTTSTHAAPEVVTDIKVPGAEVITDIKTGPSGEIITEVVEGSRLSVEAFVTAPEGQVLDKKFYTSVQDRPLDEQLIERFRERHPYLAEFETIIKDTGMERQIGSRIEALTSTETVVGTDHTIDANPIQLLAQQMPGGRVLTERPSGEGWHLAGQPQVVNTKMFAVTGDRPISKERLTMLKEHRDVEKLYEIITRRRLEQLLPAPSEREVLLRERVLLSSSAPTRPAVEERIVVGGQAPVVVATEVVST